MIVIEGMDNSGKSTLAQALGEYMSMNVQESEGPPKSDDEINARVDGYAMMPQTIFVRHPVISNSIYGKFREEGDPITPGRRILFYEAKPTLIYCDPLARGLIDHVEKDHDSPEHLEMVHQRYMQLLTEYRLWAAQYAHFVYRIGDDMDQLIATIYFHHEYNQA
jgi:hypothetical protein